MKSYNRVDTKLSIKHNRIVVNSDIKRRMRLVVSAMTAISGQVGRVVFPWEIVRYLQQQDSSYSRNDVVYAIHKCVESGLVRSVSHGSYQLTIDPRIAKTVVK